MSLRELEDDILETLSTVQSDILDDQVPVHILREPCALIRGQSESDQFSSLYLSSALIIRGLRIGSCKLYNRDDRFTMQLTTLNSISGTSC